MPDPETPKPGPVLAQFQKLATDASDAGNHSVALDALREASKRPGWQTTEFYLALGCSLVGTALQGIPGRELLGGILLAVATLSYSLSRGIAKKEGS